MKHVSIVVPVSRELLDDAVAMGALLSQRRGAPTTPRPVMQAALLFTALRLATAGDDLAAAVLDLHSPGQDIGWPTCQGCDDPEGADWPCSTVDLLTDRYPLALS